MSTARAVAFDKGNAKFQRRLRHLLNPAPEFRLHVPGTRARAEAESFIKERFLQVHGATIRDFMPALLSLNCHGALSAVAGIRAAGSGTLFLEQYLDQPIEQQVAREIGETVRRRQIVEIGNLVATEGGSSYLLFLVMAALLDQAGFRWVVFTATPRVRGIISHLGFSTQQIAVAKPERLDEGEKSEWGRYYASCPLVVCGNAAEAVQRMQQKKLLAAAVSLFKPRIDNLAGRVSALASDHGTFALTA